ncbi:MAG TPA: hypothetical protein VMB19_12895, partial [Silvibacterium sp.]|nr:hypothetical protein [Silvibacterium sp.]
MSKEICISTTPHETRLAILENDELTEIYYERENEYTLAGSIYKGRVTRVLPGMQSAFVDVGLERDAFLYVTDFLEEQDEGADFEVTGGNGRRPRREGGRENGRESSPENTARARQPEAAGEAEPQEDTGQQDSESPSGTRRWRGRRGRRRGFRSRGQHEERPQLESPEAVEESIADEPVIMPEHGAPGGVPATNRILLPGESLSKYSGTGNAEPTRPEASAQAVPDAGRARVNYTAPKPSTLVEAPLDWDGGLLMPGESLSRYRDKATSQAVEPLAEAPIAEAQAESDAPKAVAVIANEPHAAVHQGRVEPYGHVLELVAEPGEAAASPAGSEEDSAVTHPAEAHSAETAEAPTVVHSEPEQPAVAVSEAPAEAAEEEIQEEVHEFEPETASASHRVYSAPPSEFRVSSVAEEEIAVEPEDLAAITEEVRESGPIEERSAADTVDYADEAPATRVAEVADQ